MTKDWQKQYSMQRLDRQAHLSLTEGCGPWGTRNRK